MLPTFYRNREEVQAPPSNVRKRPFAVERVVWRVLLRVDMRSNHIRSYPLICDYPDRPTTFLWHLFCWVVRCAQLTHYQVDKCFDADVHLHGHKQRNSPSTAIHYSMGSFHRLLIDDHAIVKSTNLSATVAHRISLVATSYRCPLLGPS